MGYNGSAPRRVNPPIRLVQELNAYLDFEWSRPNHKPDSDEDEDDEGSGIIMYAEIRASRIRELARLARERVAPLSDDCDPLRCYYSDEEWELVRTEPRAPSARELALAREEQVDAWRERLWDRFTTLTPIVLVGSAIAICLAAWLGK